MSGTKEGSIKMMETIRRKYGVDKDGRSLLHIRIGAKGGKNGNTGGFASLEIGADGLTGRQRAHVAGIRGGRISRRRKAKSV